MAEEFRFNQLEEKHQKDMKELSEQIIYSNRKHQEQMDHIISLIQENPKLAKVKKEVLKKV